MENPSPKQFSAVETVRGCNVKRINEPDVRKASHHHSLHGALFDELVTKHWHMNSYNNRIAAW